MMMPTEITKLADDLINEYKNSQYVVDLLNNTYTLDMICGEIIEEALNDAYVDPETLSETCKELKQYIESHLTDA